MKYVLGAHIHNGHDIDEIILVINASDKISATFAFVEAMKQLGFKEDDYGHITCQEQRRIDIQI